MKKFDTIENLFIEEFQDSEEALNLAEIDLMDKLIIKNNFYKFSPYQFNVYYAVAILTSCFLNMTFIYLYLSHNNTSNIVAHHASMKNSVQSAAITKPKPSVHSIHPAISQPVETVLSQKNEDTKRTIKNENTQTTEYEYINLEKHTNASSTNSNDTGTKTSNALDKNTLPQIYKQVNKDSIHHANIHTIESQKVVSKIKPLKKIVYVTRKDTIFQTDTVKTGRRRRK